MALLSLPGELRNCIYDACLFPHHDVLPIVHCSHPKDIAATTLNSPIFRLSSTIRREALTRLLSTRTLEFSDLHTTTVFLEYIGDYCADSVTSIVILDPYLSELVKDNLRDGPTTLAIAKLKALKKVVFKMEVGEIRQGLLQRGPQSPLVWRTFEAFCDQLREPSIEVSIEQYKKL